MLTWKVNNYVLRYKDTSVFFGSEARDLNPLVEYKKHNGPVDIAILPTNGVYLFGIYQLVMKGEEAFEGAKLLGAKKLFVIHDAHPKIPGFIHIKSSSEAAVNRAQKHKGLIPEVVHVNTGIEWNYNKHNKVSFV